MNVQSIIGSKGTDVATVLSGASLREAVRLLGEWRVGCLVVSTNRTTIDGVISERDIVRALSIGAGALDQTVGSVMSTDVVTCSLDDGIDQLMALMTNRRIRHLPVLDSAGALCGIVSIGDVVKSRLLELESDNQALTDYISGR